MAWAIEQQETTDPVTRLVLMCLANYAAADGSAAFPSLARLSADTQLCERTVRYQLRKLEKLMLIRKGNSAIVAAHIARADRRPTCYELMMKPRGAPYAPRDSTGGISRPNGGHLTTERGASAGAPDPSLTINDPKSARAIPAGSCANPEASDEKRAEFKRQLKALAAKPLPKIGGH